MTIEPRNQQATKTKKGHKVSRDNEAHGDEDFLYEERDTELGYNEATDYESMHNAAALKIEIHKLIKDYLVDAVSIQKLTDVVGACALVAIDVLNSVDSVPSEYKKILIKNTCEIISEMIENG